MKFYSKYILLAVFSIGLLFLCLHYSGIVNFFPYTRGIDVSAHQGDINWQMVAKHGIDFAYIKATEANDFKDQKFSINWKSAKDAGIATGAYHYFSLAYGGEIQAKNFIDSVPVDNTSLSPVVDLEYGGNSKKRPDKNQFQKELTLFLKAVDARYGKQPIIYTTSVFYRDYLYPEMADQPIWIRDLIFPLKNNWSFWQYSQWGKISGINGWVDLDFYQKRKIDSLVQ